MARWEVEAGESPEVQQPNSLADAIPNNNKEKKNGREENRETSS